MNLLNLCFLFFFIFFTKPTLSSAVIASRAEVKILAEANKNANTLKTLKKGEEIEFKERKGMYWEVIVDKKKGIKGFVSVMEVKIKTTEESSGLSAAMRDAVQKSRSEDESSAARTRSTVMGVRGLDESEETKFAGNVKPNLRLVYNMEAYILDPTEVHNLEMEVQKEIEQRLSGPKNPGT